MEVRRSFDRELLAEGEGRDEVGTMNHFSPQLSRAEQPAAPAMSAERRRRA